MKLGLVLLFSTLRKRLLNPPRPTNTHRNLEDKSGGIALRKLLNRLQAVDEDGGADELIPFVGDADVPGIDMTSGIAVATKAHELLEELGLYEGNNATVSRFLNRILMLPEGEQNLVFNLFMAQLESVITDQKQAGTYDCAVVDLRASTVTQRGPAQLVWQDDATEAKCECVTLTLDRGVPFEEALEVR